GLSPPRPLPALQSSEPPRQARQDRYILSRKRLTGVRSRLKIQSSIRCNLRSQCYLVVRGRGGRCRGKGGAEAACDQRRREAKGVSVPFRGVLMFTSSRIVKILGALLLLASLIVIVHREATAQGTVFKNNNNKFQGMPGFGA